MWELGCAFGVATDALEKWQKNRSAQAPQGLDSRRDLLAERVAAAAEGRRVEAPVMSMQSLVALQEALGGG